jgi:hypothetical protein
MYSQKNRRQQAEEGEKQASPSLSAHKVFYLIVAEDL